MMFQLILIAFQICMKVYVEYISDEEEHAGGDDELGGLEESWLAVSKVTQSWRRNYSSVMFLRLLTMFKSAFRWQVQEATQVYQEQGAAFLPVTLEASRGIPNSEKKLPWHYVTRGSSIRRLLITCASER